MPILSLLCHPEMIQTMFFFFFLSFFFFFRNPSIESEEDELSSEDKELEWPQYTVDTKLYKELAPGMNNIVDPSGRRCRVWNDFLPKLDAALGNYNFKRLSEI